MRAYHSEFKTAGDDIGATIRINTKKGDPRVVKFEFSYSCLPYIIRQLRKVWQTERALRMNRIADIDSEIRP